MHKKDLRNEIIEIGAVRMDDAFHPMDRFRIFVRPQYNGVIERKIKKHIVAWNDAQILDESKRNDKLVEAFIKDKRRGVAASFLINFLFLAAAFVSFISTHDPASFGFLAVPGVTIAINVIKENRDEDK